MKKKNEMIYKKKKRKLTQSYTKAEITIGGVCNSWKCFKSELKYHQST